MNKFEKLYEEVKAIIHHAERNDHISEDAADILYNNLETAYEDIKAE